MHETVKVTFCTDSGEKFFGEGPRQLLQSVMQTGSLHRSAEETGISWSKACHIIRSAEKVLGFNLLVRKTGGSGGGGSELTAEGKEWLFRYEAYKVACREAGRKLFRQMYPEYASAAVIMASGQGKRFGGNKLMAPFRGEPLIGRVISATENLFCARVAVTRNTETGNYLEERGVPAIVHGLPGRNDTVRLGLCEVMKADPAGCLFCPADQPFLRRETVWQLLKKTAEEPDKIWRPGSPEGPGSPVWFPRSLFTELLALPEGKGGSVLIAKHPDLVRILTVSDPLELKDADTPEDLRLLEGYRNTGFPVSADLIAAPKPD